MVSLPSHLDHMTEPVVFSNVISHWPASQWTPESLAVELEGIPIKFRIGPRSRPHGVLWEADCDYEEMSISEFLLWLQGKADEKHPMYTFDPQEHWCYADYKYMNLLCVHKPELIEAVQWGTFGFEDRDGMQSTLWLGCKGAHTPCHFDTYGCNLVAQIYGRKRWVIFPPEDTAHIYPTRIPYEESSVFSQVDLQDPDVLEHPKLVHTSPYVVTLEPGQVLYVPRHWWHFVESLDTSLSINTWLELPTDNEDRLREAVTRTITCAFMPLGETDSNTDWLNPTEEWTDHGVNMKFLSQTVQSLSNEAFFFKTKSPEKSAEEQIPPQSTDVQIPDTSKKYIDKPETQPAKRIKLDEGSPKDLPDYLKLICGENTSCKVSRVPRYTFAEFEQIRAMPVTEWMSKTGKKEQSLNGNGKVGEMFGECEVTAVFDTREHWTSLGGEVKGQSQTVAPYSTKHGETMSLDTVLHGETMSSQSTNHGLTMDGDSVKHDQTVPSGSVQSETMTGDSENHGQTTVSVSSQLCQAMASDSSECHLNFDPVVGLATKTEGKDFENNKSARMDDEGNAAPDSTTKRSESKSSGTSSYSTGTDGKSPRDMNETSNENLDDSFSADLSGHRFQGRVKTELLVNCLTHPSVIDLVCSLIKEELGIKT